MTKRTLLICCFIDNVFFYVIKTFLDIIEVAFISCETKVYLLWLVTSTGPLTCLQCAFFYFKNNLQIKGLNYDEYKSGDKFGNVYIHNNIILYLHYKTSN